MKRIGPYFILPVCWLIISTVLHTLPGSAFPKGNWQTKIWLDKWIHVGIFFFLVVVWCRAIAQSRPHISKPKNIFVIIAGICLCYGVVMEFIQKFFIANRSFDPGDLLADTLGCVAGLVYSTSRYIKK